MNFKAISSLTILFCIGQALHAMQDKAGEGLAMPLLTIDKKSAAAGELEHESRELRRTGKLKDQNDPAFECTGFSVALQTLVKKYAMNTLGFLPVFGTRSILSEREYQAYKNRDASHRDFPTKRLAGLKADGCFVMWDGDTTIAVWDHFKSKKVREFTIDTVGMAVTTDGLVVTGKDDKFELWHPVTGKRIKTVKVGKEGVFRDFEILANGDLAAYYYGYVFILDLVTGTCKNILRTGASPNMIRDCCIAEQDMAIIFADHKQHYKYAMTEADLQILQELSGTEREILKKLIVMLNELALKEICTSIDDRASKQLELPRAAQELYSSLPAHIQALIKKHYMLAELPAVQQLKADENAGMARYCAPCVIL